MRKQKKADQAQFFDKENKKKEKKKKKRGFSSISNLVDKYQVKNRNVHVTKEYQSFGLSLADKLNDFKHKALYIKMAKDLDRIILEQALSYVSDADVVKKGALFMWKVNQLREKYKGKLKTEFQPRSTTSKKKKKEEKKQESLF